MISYLKGKILNKINNSIILVVNNIGYQIYLLPDFCADLKILSEIEIYIYQVLREDTSDLYGFKNLDELEFYKMLITVPSIGPKSAMNVLSKAGVSDIKEAIVKNDPALLTKISGLGKKTSEKIVLGLKDKVLGGFFVEAGEPTLMGDDIDALLALGYSLSEAREALSQVDPSVSDVRDRIKAALRKMTK